MQIYFRRFAERTSAIVGSAGAFLLALVAIITWAATGPLFGFSNTWQLVINTGTTIVTFLMVFLIQNTQNRDSRAIHLKLDELLRAHSSARNRMVDLEDLTDEELQRLQQEFKEVHEKAQGGSSDGLKQALQTLEDASAETEEPDVAEGRTERIQRETVPARTASGTGRRDPA